MCEKKSNFAPSNKKNNNLTGAAHRKRLKIMTRNEFENRTNVQVSEAFFNYTIHPDYMQSDLDKDDYCNEWKRQRNTWMKQMAHFEAKRADNLQAALQMEIDERKHYVQETTDLNNQIWELRKELKKYKNIVAAIKMSIPEDIEL